MGKYDHLINMYEDKWASGNAHVQQLLMMCHLANELAERNRLKRIELKSNKEIASMSNGDELVDKA